LNPYRFTSFSTGGVTGVKNLNTCVLDFCVVSDQSEFMVVFMDFRRVRKIAKSEC